MFVGGCAAQQPAPVVAASPSRAPVAEGRCYRVQMGPWAQTGQQKGLVPPTEFRLDTTASQSTFGQGSRAVSPDFVMSGVAGRRYPGFWQARGADSVQITWTTGFEKGGYLLKVRGDSVEGVATTWSDLRTGHPDPTAPVTGSRVSCKP
jgi:hypothetical protein